MAQREGAALLLGGMSPAELVAKRKGKGSPPPATPAVPPDGDDGDTSNISAVSALHQLAGALGVSVKDEDAGVQAMHDLVKACGNYEE